MTPRFLIAAMAGLGLVAGCAGNRTEPQCPPRGRARCGDPDSFSTAWSQRAGRGLGRAGYPIAPARDGDTLFAADARGRVAALAADGGDRRWQVDLEVPVSSALTAVAGDVYLGTRNGEVLALNQRDGSVRWRARVPSEVLAAPQPNRQLLVVQSVDGSVTALDRSSGEERWR